jgi:hypothetical protein
LAAFLEEALAVRKGFFILWLRPQVFLLDTLQPDTLKKDAMPSRIDSGLPPNWGAHTTNHDGAGGRNHAHF